MIKEAIDAIQELADSAHGARVFSADAEPQGVYYLAHQNGDCERVTALPPYRNHQARDLESLVACTKRLAPEGSATSASIWCSRQGVTALFDDGERRDRMTLPLALSPQLKTLLKWSGDAPTFLEQAALVRVLRNTFRRSVQGTGLVEVFRRLKIRSSAEGEAVVEHGRASVGKSIEASVQGVAALPEEIVLSEAAFDGGALGIVAQVRCTVEIEVRTAQVAIYPLAGAVEESLLAAEARLRELVLGLVGDDEHTSVYLGAP